MPKSSPRPKPDQLIAGVPAALVPSPRPKTTKPRQLNPGKTRILHRQKGLKNPNRLPKGRQLAAYAGRLLWHNRRLFIGITLTYLLLVLLLVRNFSGTADVTKLTSAVDSNAGKFAGSLGAFAVLVSTSTSSTSDVAGVYRALLIIIASLAVIWALRQVLASANKVRIRDAFYQGMYPLIPVVLVMLMIGLQLLPLVLGVGVYSLVVSNGIAALPIEQILWALLALILAVLSVYWVTSSVFALYIVALPDMTPMRALRSARQLVRYRRWTVLRKVLFLPLMLCLISLVLVVPTILIATAAASFVFFLLGIVYLPIVHAYMYSLYRELLK